MVVVLLHDYECTPRCGQRKHKSESCRRLVLVNESLTCSHPCSSCELCLAELAEREASPTFALASAAIQTKSLPHYRTVLHSIAVVHRYTIPLSSSALAVLCRISDAVTVSHIVCTHTSTCLLRSASSAVVLLSVLSLATR